MTHGSRARRALVDGLVLAGVLGGVACSSGGGGDPLPTAASLDIVASANGQTAPGGARLPLPLAVIARASDGSTVARAGVRWQVVAGTGAALTDSVTMSDGNGRAEVVLTLGPAAGEYRVSATPVDAPNAAVTLTATATPPPQLSSVTPSNFTAGDTLTLAGTGLSASAEVLMAGATALVVGGSAAAVTIVAPPCLVPGTVQIQARVAGAPSNAITGTYASALSPLALSVGEYVSVPPTQLAACATFPAAGADTVEYLLAPQSVTGVPGVSASYRLRGDSVVVTLRQREEPRPTALPLATRFHDALREQEAAAARLPHAPLEAALRSVAESPTVKVGDVRTFQVCNTIPCADVDDFAAVTARAEYVGSHAALFVDQAAPAGGFTASDYASLGALFDDDLYDVATRAFGSESDVDRNGVTIILLTPEVNRLTPTSQCGTSIITGYFFGIDIDPLFQTNPRSNRGEVFYALAPDPGGTVTCALDTDAVRRLVPVTFVHEFQHMISYFQHVLVRNGDSEILWLNEGLSHISEELAALHFEAQGRDSLFTRFAIGDLFNAYQYLSNPGGVWLLPVSGTGSLEERGAAWLFLRWLLDQYGEDLTRLLVETGRVGADNVSAAAAQPFERLVTQWFLANWVSDLPGFTAPARLRYVTWQYRTTFQSLHDQLPSRFPNPFPLRPMLLGPGTFQFDGTLRSGSGDYIRIRQAPGEKGFTILMTDLAGGSLPASVAGRLNVIRIR